MADKRTDKDDNVKEERSWQFIQEHDLLLDKLPGTLFFYVVSRYQEGRSSDILY